jgi:protein-L-isoaspartate(D-aspartate) O-methyltransferase
MRNEFHESYGQQARQWMVDGQLATNKITDPAISHAFLTTPRELFVPDAFQASAYVDEPIPLGNGRYMVEPMVLATWLQALKLRADDRVLVIGGNTGYSAALIAPLVAHVALEDDGVFASQSKHAIDTLGLSNISCPKTTPEDAQYDVIIIEGSIEALPESLGPRLAEGGRMAYAVPLGSHGHMATLIIAENHADSLVERSLSDAPVPRLPGFEMPKQFQFA